MSDAAVARIRRYHRVRYYPIFPSRMGQPFRVVSKIPILLSDAPTASPRVFASGSALAQRDPRVTSILLCNLQITKLPSFASLIG
jgi:hypothetical protein